MYATADDEFYVGTAMDKPKAIYTSRINQAIDYVIAHLDEAPSLEDISNASCFSSFHFHRIFSAITGETVRFYTNRLRLEKSTRLINYSANSITHIAHECGFSSSSTFSRSFKQHFGISPIEYKKGNVIKNSKICKELFPIDDYIIPLSAEQLREKFPVQVKEYSKRRVVFIRVIGSYQENRVLEAFTRMIKWAKQMNLYKTESIFGMSLDDPKVTPRDQNSYDVCLTIPDTLKLTSEQCFSEKVMEKGLYAVCRISGDLRVVATVWEYMFRHWLVNSHYEPEHQHAIEIFLDKSNVTNWDHFDLELCLPIKKLNQTSKN